MSLGGRFPGASARWSVSAVVLVLLLSLGLPGSTHRAQAGGDTWYVKKSATGANDGKSWDSAFTSLQSALAVATSGDVVYVAAGAYVPSVPSGRNATFAIPNGVKLFGSFQGDEPSLSQRVIPTIPTTILSGNRGPSRGPADNSYHVVTVTGLSTLDGFTITSGNANAASPPNDRGANLLVTGSFGTFRNLLVASGNATWDAGGAYAQGDHALFEDVVFSGNTSSRNGGGLTALDATIAVRNATFTGNESGDGGALWTIGTGENLTFVGNTGQRGSAVATYEGAVLNGVTIHHNTATLGGGQGPLYSSTAGTLKLTNAIIWDNPGESPIGQESGADIEIEGGIVEGGCPVGIACTNVRNVDPQLAAAAGNHGGFVPTLAIPEASPAVDAAPAAGCPTVDARGAERPFDVGGDGGNTCDFGAYEFVSLPELGITLESEINEGDAAHEVFVEPSHAYPETITADLAFADGTAKNGKDYTASNASITLDPFDTILVAGFSLTDDALDEPAETFKISLSNLVNAIPAPTSSVDVPIEDNDDPPSIGFVQSASDGLEAVTLVKLSVALSAPSGRDVQIGYVVTGGSAKPGEDFNAVTQPVTIPAGETNAVLRLKVVNDFVPEVDDQVLLALAQPANVTIAAADTHTYTIKNDDKVRSCQGQKVTIYGTPGKDRLAGTPGRDVIDGLGGDDTIRGAAGNDVLCGSGGKDVLRGGSGKDTLNGGGAADRLLGGAGDDTLLGKAGADTLRGELGRDRLAGGGGKPDVCDGGPSTDSLLPAHGCESVAGVP